MRVRRAALAAVALIAVAAPSAAYAEEPLDYVALGDSSASGSGVPNQIDLVCTRSDRNWPRVAAAKLGARLTDVTCGGAKTGDLAGRQFGFVAPQYAALKPDTDLVTIAIGANDISMGTVVPSCIRLHPEGAGGSCKAYYTSGGRDQLAERIAATAPKVAAALDEIHRRSPSATVLVVGYGTYFAPGGCWPTDPIWAGDADYIQATFDRLHAMLANQAAKLGARYVDIRTPSASHGVCAPPGRRWMEGLAPASPAAPYHPNATGLAHAGATVAAAV
ncbi:MAG: SGNH/GDSL hydrolase family protein [Micromonosporaceae bacterium]